MWTRAAVDRIAELEPELIARFGAKPILTERQEPNAQRPLNATTWEDVERWLLERGVNARIEAIDGSRLSFDRLALTSESAMDLAHDRT